MHRPEPEATRTRETTQTIHSPPDLATTLIRQVSAGVGAPSGVDATAVPGHQCCSRSVDGRALHPVCAAQERQAERALDGSGQAVVAEEPGERATAETGRDQN